MMDATKIHAAIAAARAAGARGMDFGIVAVDELLELGEVFGALPRTYVYDRGEGSAIDMLEVYLGDDDRPQRDDDRPQRFVSFYVRAQAVERPASAEELIRVRAEPTQTPTYRAAVTIDAF